MSEKAFDVIRLRENIKLGQRITLFALDAFEDGKWQYAVTVMAKKGGLYEVEVSSTTGRVTDTEKTTPAEETKEATADKKAAQPHHAASSNEKGEAGEKD